MFTSFSSLQVMNSTKMQELLPDHVIFNGILTKLPYKSLSRFKCVNKFWCSWITSPQFAKLHLLNQDFSTLTEDDFIAVSTAKDQNLFSLPNIEYWAMHYNDSLINNLVKMDYPFKSLHTHPYILGSCNGILLVHLYDLNNVMDAPKSLKLCIWNPCREDDHITLPSLIFFDPFEMAFGFGYDSTTDDYKVIVVFDSTSIIKECVIYTTKTNKWRNIPRVALPLDMCFCGSGHFVNGAVHWLGRRVQFGEERLHSFLDDGFLICFNFMSEEWREIPFAIDAKEGGDEFEKIEEGPGLGMTRRGELYVEYTYYDWKGEFEDVEGRTYVHVLMNKGHEFYGCWRKVCCLSSLGVGKFPDVIRATVFTGDNIVSVSGGDDDGYGLNFHDKYEFGRRFINAFVEVHKTRPHRDWRWYEAVHYRRSLVSPRQLLIN